MDVFRLFSNYIVSLIGVLNVKFPIMLGGTYYQVSIIGVVLVVLIISMAITVFWKGARG